MTLLVYESNFFVAGKAQLQKRKWWIFRQLEKFDVISCIKLPIRHINISFLFFDYYRRPIVWTKFLAASFDHSFDDLIFVLFVQVDIVISTLCVSSF